MHLTVTPTTSVCGTTTTTHSASVRQLQPGCCSSPQTRVLIAEIDQKQRVFAEVDGATRLLSSTTASGGRCKAAKKPG